MNKLEKYINNSISDCTNKTIIITGANSGIGFEAMKIFVQKGAKVIMACRSFERANNAKEKVLSSFPNAKIDILEYDQASFVSIKKFSETIKNINFDVLICNAGIFHPKKGKTTKDSFPLTVGTNYLGLFYLIENIKDFLGKRKLILVSSITYAHCKIKEYDFLRKETTSIFKQYSISKTCITRYFAYLKNNSDLNIYLMHPGVSATNIFASKTSSYKQWFKKLAMAILPLFVHSPKKASLGMVKLVSETYPNHTFLGPRGLFQISGYPRVVKLKKNGYLNNELLYKKSKELVTEVENNVKC